MLWLSNIGLRQRSILVYAAKGFNNSLVVYLLGFVLNVVRIWREADHFQTGPIGYLSIFVPRSGAS